MHFINHVKINKRIQRFYTIHQLMSVKKYVLSQLSVKLQLVPTTYFRALLISYLNKHSITCSLVDRHIYCTACLTDFANIAYGYLNLQTNHSLKLPSRFSNGQKYALQYLYEPFIKISNPPPEFY